MKFVFIFVMNLVPLLSFADCYSGGPGHRHGGAAGVAAAVTRSKGGSEMSLSNYTQFAAKSSTENTSHLLNTSSAKQTTTISSNPMSRKAEPQDFFPFASRQSFSIVDITEEGGYHTMMKAGTIQWLYGIVLSCHLHKRLAMLGEWRGSLPTDFSTHSGILNMGGVFDLSRRLSVLLAVSRSIQGTSDQPSALASYTGFQFSL